MSTTFASRLREIRQLKGLSQPKFADFVGIPYGSYKKYEEDREPPLSAILKIITHEDFKQYGHWLMTGELPDFAVHTTPNNPIDENNQLSKAEFNGLFVEKSADTIALFLDMEWFLPNPNKAVDLRDCGKLMLKELNPIIDNIEGMESSSQVVVKIK